jgi:hypothetical protein
MSYTPKERSGTTAQVCASVSLRKYDPFHDYQWNWKPHLRHRKTSRKLKPMSYRQLVEFMMHQPL